VKTEITSKLEFVQENSGRAIDAFLTLPQGLRPTHYCVGERDVRKPIPDRSIRLETLPGNSDGFFLKGPHVVYNIRHLNLAKDILVICDCFLKVDPNLVKQFLIHMATALPIFGFACTWEEECQRNRVTVEQSIGTIESWVGRDVQKYIPGFYWLTLIPDVLAKQHNVSLSDVDKVAQEHIVIEGGQHLFRFYEKPEDWQKTSAVAELCASLPGVFDVDRVKPHLLVPKNFMELNSMLRNWN